jgi:carbamoyltransferase
MILGISAFYHDSAAALIRDGEIIAAAQEERFTRRRHDPDFPVNAIRYCLESAGCSPADLSAVVFYDKPFLKFERLLETYCALAPKGLPSFLKSMPVWLDEKLFLKRRIRNGMMAVGGPGGEKTPLLFTEHHLSHAASAFYPSAFNDAAILTVDGVGEWATASIGHGEGSSIRVLKELHFPHSVGLLYSAFTYYCGFRVNSGEYKLMGLAPYGDATSAFYRRSLDVIRTKLTDIREDGSVFLDQDYFSYAAGLRMVPDRKWAELFGIGRRQPESEITKEHCDLALAIQTVTEEIVLKMAQEAKKLTGSRRLCMAGGVALNAVANGRLHGAGIFEEIFIQPAAGDAGGALGAALAAHHIHFGQARHADGKSDAQKGSLLGPAFSDEAIAHVLRGYGASYQEYAEDELLKRVALLLSEGQIIGWFQGRMEFGPRSLGNRSILADARRPDMQRKLNLSIKYREGFRPFAPAVLYEDVGDYFEMSDASPYMLMVKPVRRERRQPLPEGYAAMEPLEMLQQPGSDIPAVTHVDGSARIQTVHAETNERFWRLLRQFKDITGYSLLINTSFNIRGEPVVHDPADAYRCFMNTEMDYLAIGNFLLDRRQQPEFPAVKRPKIIDPD